METKVCIKCNTTKDISLFRKSKYGYRGECKECENARSRQYNKEHRNELNKKRREKYKNNEDFRKLCLIRNTKNRSKEYQKKYYEEHKEYYSNYAKKHRKEHWEEYREKNKKWCENNREHLKQLKRENNKKRMKDPIERTKNRVRNMIRNSFERKGMTKSKKTEEIIGCSIETLVQELIDSYERNY